MRAAAPDIVDMHCTAGCSLRVHGIDAAKGGVIKASCALLQDCEPLVLTHPASGDEFSFAGVQGVLSAAVEAADAFSPLTAVGTGPTRIIHSCSGMKQGQLRKAKQCDLYGQMHGSISCRI